MTFFPRSSYISVSPLIMCTKLILKLANINNHDMEIGEGVAGSGSALGGTSPHLHRGGAVLHHTQDTNMTRSVIKTHKVTQVIQVYFQSYLHHSITVNAKIKLVYDITSYVTMDYEKSENSSLHLAQCEDIREFKIQIHVNYNYIDFTFSMWC